MKNSWRYIPYENRMIENIVSYDPTDDIIANLDGDDMMGPMATIWSVEELCDSSHSLLTKRQKIVLYHRIVDGFTFQQIANKMSTSRQNCCEIFYKALERIRLWLEQSEGGEGI